MGHLRDAGEHTGRYTVGELLTPKDTKTMIAHRVRALLALLLLLLTLAACAQPPAADETRGDDSAPTPTAAPAAEATQTSSPLPAATPSPSPAFSLEALRHGEYQFEGQTIRLEAGQAELPIVEGSASTMKVTLLEEAVAFGDLNGDGVEDAAAVMTVDMGGSGTFYHLVAILNRDGQPEQTASHLLGDRIQVKSIGVEAGEITMEMVWAGPEDPMCCPTQEVTAQYVLQDEIALVLPPTPVPVLPYPTTELTPEQVSIDLGTLAESIRGEVRPEVPFGPGPGIGWGEPRHLRFSFDGEVLEESTFLTPRQLLIYPAEAFREMFRDPAGDLVGAEIEALRTLLEERPAAPDGPLPFLPNFNAVQITTAQAEYVDFEGGSGIRYLTAYAQDVSPLMNENVFYTFQGLTDDGQYYLSLFYPVSTASLPDTFADSPAATADMEAWGSNYQSYIAETTEMLNGLTSSDFSPALTELDAMMASLQLSAPSAEGRPIHTSVVLFEPTIPAEVQEGSCFSSSIAAPREGAWRCMVGNAIHDPCFTAADGATLVCGADPIEGTEGFQLKLTEPLPAAEIPADLPPMAWLLRLSDGSICNFATGATGAVGDKRANYLCSDQSVILGDLQVNDAGTWLAEKAFVTVGENGMEAQEVYTIAVMELWQ